MTDLHLLGVEEQWRVAAPDIPASAKSRQGYCAGGAQAIWDGPGDRILAAWRLWNPPDGSPNERGFALHIAESRDDGRTWRLINRITKRDVGRAWVGVSALRRTPAGELELLLSQADLWRGSEIARLSAAGPEALGWGARVPALLPERVAVDGERRPVHGVVHPVLWKNGMFFSAAESAHGPEPTYLATDIGGGAFSSAGRAVPVGEAGAWDAFRARVTGLVDLASGEVLAFYDGAADPEQEGPERAGLLLSGGGLMKWRRLTPGEPAFVSPHGRGSLRHIFPLVLSDGRVLLVWEREEPDGSQGLWAGHTTVANLGAAVHRLGT